MSNRSSHVNFRQSLVHLPHTPEQIPKLDKLNRKVISDQPYFRSREAFEILQEYKLTIYNPVAVNQPSEIPFSDVFPSMANIYSKTEGIGEETEVVISKKEFLPGYKRLNPDTILLYDDSKDKFLPSYLPNYFTAPPDTKLFSQCFHYYSESIGLKVDGSIVPELEGYTHEQEAEMIFGKEDSLKYYGENFAFTSGTLRGQVERLRANTDVNQGVGDFHKVKTLREQKLSFDDVGRILERFLPLPPYDEDNDLPLTGNYMNYVTLLDQDGKKFLFSYMAKFQPDTKAGMPFRQVAKKKDVRWDAIVMANTFLYDLTQALEEKNINSVNKLMKDYWFLSVGYLFPKAERYRLVNKMHKEVKYSQVGKKIVKEEKDQLRYEAEKTRNIWSTSFVTHILASQSKVKLEAPGALNVDNYDTPSLYKWSPWQGGMDRMVKRILRLAENFSVSKKSFETHSFIYADNWYLLELGREGGEITSRWLSLDQTKGEANATRSHMAAFENYLLNTCYTKEKPNGSVEFYYNSTWGYFYRNLLPAMTVNMTGLFGNMLVKIPGQGSGNTNTFYVNHTMSAICVDYYEKSKLNKEKLDVNMLGKVSEQTGVDWKIELDNVDIVKKLINLKNNPIEFRGLKTPTIVTMDLLGYDAGFAKMNNEFVPILARERLFKNAMLPKNFKSENKVVVALYNNIRYNSLLMVGGWAYPTLRMALESLVTDNYRVLSKFSDVEPLVKEAQQGIELPVDLQDLDDEDVLVYISGVAEAPEEEIYLKLFKGEPKEAGKRGKYVFLKQNDQVRAKTLMLAPGFNIVSPITKGIAEASQKTWADMADEEDPWEITKTPYTKEGLGKLSDREIRLYSLVNKPGKKVVAISSSKRGNLFQFTLSNDSELVSTNESLYTIVASDTVWAKFKQNLTGYDIVNPAGKGVAFDKDSGKILRDRYKRVHTREIRVDTTGLNKTQKKNVKRRYATLDEYKEVKRPQKEEETKLEARTVGGSIYISEKKIIKEKPKISSYVEETDPAVLYMRETISNSIKNQLNKFDEEKSKEVAEVIQILYERLGDIGGKLNDDRINRVEAYLKDSKK